MSTIQFWQADEQPITAPLEWQAALLELNDVDWQTAVVYLQGQRLRVYQQIFAGQVRVLTQWRATGAGYYQLSVNQHQQRIYIAPHKISPAALQALLTDLEWQLPINIATGLARGGAELAVTFNSQQQPTLASEYWQLVRIIQGDATHPAMHSWLPQLAQQPLQKLHAVQQLVTPAVVRHPRPSAIARWQLQPTHLMQDSRSQLHVNIYENQLLKLFLQQLARHLQRLEHLAQGQLKVKTQQLAQHFQHCQAQADFLSKVRLPTHLTLQITPALQRLPPYQAFFNAYQAYRRNCFSLYLQAPQLAAPLNNLPYLYQLWCSLQVIHSLLTVAKMHDYQVIKQQLVVPYQDSTYLRVLPDGQPAVVLQHITSGAVVSLIPQRNYRQESISFLQRPDLAIELQLPQQQKRVCLFDPKYRLAQNQMQPTKPDIDKMHAYRDAIRIDGQCIVTYAAILYPGTYQQYHSGLAALPAYPSQAQVLQQHLQQVLTDFLL